MTRDERALEAWSALPAAIEAAALKLPAGSRAYDTSWPDSDYTITWALTSENGRHRTDGTWIATASGTRTIGEAVDRSVADHLAYLASQGVDVA